MKRRVVIMGAAGRDFHNFNVFFRDNEEYEVVAFTATQIPGIDDKKYLITAMKKKVPDMCILLFLKDLFRHANTER